LDWKARGRNWASRNASSSRMGSLVVTLVLATVHSRVHLSIVLVDKEEGTHGTCSCSAHFNHSVSTLRHHGLLHLSRITPTISLCTVDGENPST
jgi:hypothetical protein